MLLLPQLHAAVVACGTWAFKPEADRHHQVKLLCLMTTLGCSLMQPASLLLAAQQSDSSPTSLFACILLLRENPQASLIVSASYAASCVCCLAQASLVYAFNLRAHQHDCKLSGLHMKVQHPMPTQNLELRGSPQ